MRLAPAPGCACSACADYLKCPHALAWGTTNLIFSVLEFRPAYEASKQLDVAMGTIKWALDWLVKAHVKAGNSPGDNAFVGQVGGGCWVCKACGGAGGVGRCAWLLWQLPAEVGSHQGSSSCCTASITQTACQQLAHTGGMPSWTLLPHANN